MTDDAEPAVIFSAAEARRRYLIYVAMKLAGLAALFGGVFLARSDVTPASLVLLGVGGATLFVRPKSIGLTTGPTKGPTKAPEQ